MKVYITQIYVKPGVNFPFSHLMQRRLSSEISSVTDDSVEFQSRYGSDYSIVMNVSADTGITENQVRGPQVFKKSKDVEYTVFLPYDVIMAASDGLMAALGFLMAGVRVALAKAGIDTGRFDERKAAIMDGIYSDATMLSRPWPRRE